MSELKDIIRGGEGVDLDFKFRVDDQKKIARTICAFANSQGGKLLIGVKDNGKISGVNPEEEFYMIQGAAELHCQPEIEFDTKVWQEEHYLVLEVEVPKSTVRHKAKDEKDKWSTYYRIEDNTARGNKILDKLWYYRHESVPRPEKFSDVELGLLAIIRKEQPISISKIYRSTTIKMNGVDKFIASLLHWGIIELSVSEDGFRYSFSD